MSEAEYFAAADPQPLLAFLRGNGVASSRKQQLFAIACCRRIWARLDEPLRRGVSMAQRHPNYFASDAELEAASAGCVPRVADDDPPPAPAAAYWACSGSVQAAQAAAESAVAAVPPADRDRERAEQARVVRDIFGNPFRTIRAVDGADGQVGEAVEIARLIYDGNLFEPEQFEDLAAALGRVGSDMAAHCREERDHVPGCWVVDALLGTA